MPGIYGFSPNARERDGVIANPSSLDCYKNVAFNADDILWMIYSHPQLVTKLDVSKLDMFDITWLLKHYKPNKLHIFLCTVNADTLSGDAKEALEKYLLEAHKNND